MEVSDWDIQQAVLRALVLLMVLFMILSPIVAFLSS